MAKKRESNTGAGEGHVSVPLRMPRDLALKVDQASERTKLAKQDVMRLSMDRGIDVLLAQLTNPPAATAPAIVAA